MNSFLRNTVSKLYNAVSAPVQQHEMHLQKTAERTWNCFFIVLEDDKEND